MSQLVAVLTVALSIVGLLFGLSNGDEKVSFAGLSTTLQHLLAYLAGGTLLLSLLDLIFGWSRQANEHAASFRALADLSAVYSGAEKTGDERTNGDIDLAAEYDRVMGLLTPLSDRAAKRSKVKQNRKKELFTRSDQNPTAPLWLLRARMLKDAIWMNHTEEEDTNDRGEAHEPDEG